MYNYYTCIYFSVCIFINNYCIAYFVCVCTSTWLYHSIYNNVLTSFLFTDTLTVGSVTLSNPSPPVILGMNSQVSFTCTVGVTLSCNGSCSFTLNVTLLRSGSTDVISSMMPTVMGTDQMVDGSNPVNTTFQITVASVSDAGLYQCAAQKVSDGPHVHSSAVNLTIQRELIISLPPQMHKVCVPQKCR